MVITKHEIAEELAKKGEFVQMGYLSDLLKKDTSTDAKLFICIKLAELYEKRRLYTEAAKVHHIAAIISMKFEDKIKHHLRETEFYIKAGNFLLADDAMKKAMSQANSSERNGIYETIKQFYLTQAEVYEKEKRRNHASKIYEKVLEMRVGDVERQRIKQRLLELYDKLGKTKEYFKLKKDN